MPHYMFGFSGRWYIDLVYFEGDAIPTLVDKERHVEGHAILDKIVPQPTETTHSLLSSASVSSAEADELLYPQTSSTSIFSFHLPSTVQPTLQFATPLESVSPNTLPHVIAKSEGDTF